MTHAKQSLLSYAASSHSHLCTVITISCSVEYLMSHARSKFLLKPVNVLCSNSNASIFQIKSQYCSFSPSNPELPFQAPVCHFCCSYFLWNELYASGYKHTQTLLLPSNKTEHSPILPQKNMLHTNTCLFL